MSKLFLLTFLLCSWASAEEVFEQVLYKKFIPTAFGIRSRTIDYKDAAAVIAEVKNFKELEPLAQITRLEILTCASDYHLPTTRLPQIIDEHLLKAKERNEMVKSELRKSYPYIVEGTSKRCGPQWKAIDLNDRFIDKNSGESHAVKFNELLSSAEFIKSLKEEALVENSATLIELYPTPFLAKYKPFQGIRLNIWGERKEARKREKPKASPSGKSQ